MKHAGDFNGDLKFGQSGEQEVLRMFDSIEVKMDRQVATTGNVWVEFESYGRPSGISISNAKFWAFVFEEVPYEKKVVVMIETERLRRHMQLWAIDIKAGGDYNTSKGYIIPKERLLSYP